MKAFKSLRDWPDILWTICVSSALFLTILTSCNDEEPEPGLNSLIRTTSVLPGAECESGGININSGLDMNRNGTLEEEEITSSSYICNGINALQSLISVEAIPAGINCENGGQAVHIGQDLDENGILDEIEVAQTQYICNGINGLVSLVIVTDEAAGINCSNGGSKIESGLDSNSDGVLDAEEIDNTSYVCNGVNESQDQVIIDDLVTDEIQDALDEFGITLNEGTNPPSLGGTYLANNQTLLSSNIAGDTPGNTFVDLTFQVTNQNNSDLSVTLFTQEGDISSGEGTGGFIIGANNLFTIIFENLDIRNDGLGQALTIEIFSGELTETGIRNFERVLVMKDDFGDPNNIYIEVGEGRHIIDQDRFSELVDEDISSETNSRMTESSSISAISSIKH